MEEFCDEKEMPLNNIILAETVGAPALTGRFKSFIANLKNKVQRIYILLHLLPAFGVEGSGHWIRSHTAVFKWILAWNLHTCRNASSVHCELDISSLSYPNNNAYIKTIIASVF